ncbi:hypothetical protein [Erythrobacter sp. F6033]|uniref:hypothetical protein n=1 Tax=Erythrobacter sp. F6033 TaxID=2926401 RepID=UPI001FF2A33F|nr:hypothetical protein [Erythrobacter sp. F6033]MCK0127742.1 hypothetical protein [Erythrobacter sp. F6033]
MSDQEGDHDDSRYMTNEELEARRWAALPWHKRMLERLLSAGCSIDLFVIVLLIGLPTLWFS